MSKFYLQIFVFILTLTRISNADIVGESKIKGGRAAKAGEFPFIGQIKIPTDDEFASVCGCALVTTSRVVTAGHCVMSLDNGKREMFLIKQGKVFFGTLYLMSDDGQTSNVDSVKFPEKIRKKKLGGFMHDYAIAELVTPLKITDTVKPMEVYSKDKTEFKNAWDELVATKAPCLIIGWGATSFRIENDSVVTKGLSKYLKTTFATPWDEHKCSKFEGRDQDNMVPFGEICLLGVTFGDTSLPGDSGGPLLCGDYVWAVCSSMFVDESGTLPFKYLLHWNYLNEFLYPNTSPAIASTLFIPLVILILFFR